jgi:hypothetical protein
LSTVSLTEPPAAALIGLIVKFVKDDPKESITVDVAIKLFALLDAEPLVIR